MKKTIFGLLLAVCMLLSLLPVTALADEPQTAKILILSTIEMAVTEGGEPAYLKNKEFDAFAKEDGSSTFKAWTQEAATKDDWNIKFEWPAGGTPTVTLKDAKMDYYDNATETYAYIKHTDGTLRSTANRLTADLENGGPTAKNLVISGILPAPDCHIDLKVVLEGDNLIETGCGVIFGDLSVKDKSITNQYLKNVTITSVDKGQLVADGSGIGIHLKSGYGLILDNAYVEISTNIKGSNADPIHISNGSLTINGGHLKVTNPKNVAIRVIGKGGDITINGDVTVSHNLTSTAQTGGIHSRDGILTINGGNIVGFSDNAPILSAGKALIINGGNLNLTSGHYGICPGTDADFQINGGTIEITAKHALFRKPTLGPNMVGVAGPNAEECEPYEEKLVLNPWMLLTDDATKLPSTTPTEAPSQTPTEAPTQAPTQAPTKAPVQATKPAATQEGSDLLVPIVAAVVILAVAAVAVILILKKKK